MSINDHYPPGFSEREESRKVYMTMDKVELCDIIEELEDTTYDLNYELSKFKQDKNGNVIEPKNRLDAVE